MAFYELPKKFLKCQNLVNGHWQDSTSDKIKVLSPYNCEQIGEVPKTSAAEVNEAIKFAQAAADGWKKTPIKERSTYMYKLRDLMLRDLMKMANVAAAESGKTVQEAKAGILKGVEVMEYALSLQNLDVGGTIEVSRGVTCEYRREPLGVVAGIVPFNFPAMVPCWMFPIAITLGNAFVLKPSEKVPLTSQLMGNLFIEAGFPEGVFTIINGDKTTVDAIIENESVKAVAFVGSTAVAKAVYQKSTALGKRALALGGAKNPNIVVPDADTQIAVRGVLDSFTGCCGQRCMAASLMLAVGDVDDVIKQIVEAAKQIKLGDQMGAIIDTPSLDRIHEYIARAEKSGAEILLDGRSPQAPKGFEKGTWMGPTIIVADPDHELVTTEIFGPVLTIVKVKSLTEAMEIEKKNPYGNACSVFTTSGAVARFVTHNATAGMTGINIGVPVPREPFSFGGTKDSKFGQGEITGEGSLDFWSDRKKITTKWTAQDDKNWMS